MGHFSGEKTRGDGYWVSRDSAHYKQRGFKSQSSQQRTIRSGRACAARNAPSWHLSQSSEPLVHACQPKAARRKGFNDKNPRSVRGHVPDNAPMFPVFRHKKANSSVPQIRMDF